MENGMQILDLLLSGVLPRFPDAKFVSVESGIGFIPFILEAADYAFGEAAMREERPEFELLPSEYFHRQVYGCWFFEETRAAAARRQDRRRQHPVRDRLPASDLPVRQRAREDRRRARRTRRPRSAASCSGTTPPPSTASPNPS